MSQPAKRFSASDIRYKRITDPDELSIAISRLGWAAYEADRSPVVIELRRKLQRRVHPADRVSIWSPSRHAGIRVTVSDLEQGWGDDTLDYCVSIGDVVSRVEWLIGLGNKPEGTRSVLSGPTGRETIELIWNRTADAVFRGGLISLSA